MMQASSAISVELCDAQPCTIVGSKGTATGVHRTRTRHMNPRILLQEKNYRRISVQSSNDFGNKYRWQKQLYLVICITQNVLSINQGIQVFSQRKV